MRLLSVYFMDAILQFLPCETPEAWLESALINQSMLLIDHANCEKKAAANAINLIHRHTLKPDLLSTMSRLAREELLHFQQVVKIMADRGVAYVRLSPSRYAAGLHSLIRQTQHEQLVDMLIVGAYIEARSCERFAKLASRLDRELAQFYKKLLKSEARHFEDYLKFAEKYAEEDVSARIEDFAEKEEKLITTPDQHFRFHSGIPLTKKSYYR